MISDAAPEFNYMTVKIHFVPYEVIRILEHKHRASRPPANLPPSSSYPAQRSILLISLSFVFFKRVNSTIGNVCLVLEYFTHKRPCQVYRQVQQKDICHLPDENHPLYERLGFPRPMACKHLSSDISQKIVFAARVAYFGILPSPSPSRPALPPQIPLSTRRTHRNERIGPSVCKYSQIGS